MDNTILQQGKFTADGNNKVLQIRSDVDWMKVINYTVAGASQTTAVGVEYYWQRGMAAGTGIEYKKSNAANAANLTAALASGGFTLIDSSIQSPGALNNGSTGVSAISNATPPVVTVGSTAGMSAGNVVRMYNVTNGQQIGGMDFTVGYNTFSGTTFSLDYMTTLGAGVGAAGSFRVIPFDPIFYPRRRYVTSVTTGATTIIKMSVTHGYTVGQAVRFIVPDAFGMTQLNGLIGNIIAINTTTTSGNTITVDIDSSAFTAFAFPASTAVPVSFAEVVPVGEDTPTALAYGQNILADATLNTSYIGMQLSAGANSPAGSASDVIYWVAGKSFSVDNQ
jgi:hypothetical protein